MHFYTILDHEFEGLDGYWHRVEVAEIPSDQKGNFTVEVFSYRRERQEWMPCHCQQCAMERDRLYFEWQERFQHEET